MLGLCRRRPGASCSAGAPASGRAPTSTPGGSWWRRSTSTRCECGGGRLPPLPRGFPGMASEPRARGRSRERLLGGVGQGGIPAGPRPRSPHPSGPAGGSCAVVLGVERVGPCSGARGAARLAAPPGAAPSRAAAGDGCWAGRCPLGGGRGGRVAVGWPGAAGLPLGVGHRRAWHGQRWARVLAAHRSVSRHHALLSQTGCRGVSLTPKPSRNPSGRKLFH